MYKCTKKLMYLVFILVIPTLLTACGGAASDGGSTPPGDTTNKPDINSSAASAEPRSSVASSTASSTIGSSVAPASSSKAGSSVSYARVSRSSQSSTSQDSGPEFDFLAPEATQLRLYRLSDNSITLAWDKSFDNVGISHYKVERNGELLAMAQGSNHILADQNLTPFTDYTYTITAFDFAGNDSGVSAPLRVRTLGSPNSSRASQSSIQSSTISASSMQSSTISTSSIQSSTISTSSRQSSIISTSSMQSSNVSKSSQQSSSKSSSSSSTGTSKSTSSVASSISNQGLVKLSWSHPNQRENGTYLTIDEISGYEVRFKRSADKNYTYMILAGNRTTSFTTDLIPANSIVEIAVYDTNGLYSAFTPISANAP